MKKSPLHRYTPIKKKRSKARPGRLKGEAMEKLRRDCFERDGYRCQAFRMIGSFKVHCYKRVTWETGQMAHIKAKRIGLDTLDNVRTECAECHNEYHQYGPSRVKPVPPKTLGLGG